MSDLNVFDGVIFSREKKPKFNDIPMATADTITLSQGYVWKTVVSWGEPLSTEGVPFEQKYHGSGESHWLA